jgi:hypothetical protein
VSGKVSWPLFWALIAVFVVIIVGFLLTPPFIPAFIGPVFLWFINIFGSIFLLLGVALIVLTVRERVEGKLKAFFLLTGASAAGFFVSFLLHNAVYALFIHFFGEGFWNGGDEPFFFIMAVFVCPLGFLVGAIGSIVLRRKGAVSPQP